MKRIDTTEFEQQAADLNLDWDTVRGLALEAYQTRKLYRDNLIALRSEAWKLLGPSSKLRYYRQFTDGCAASVPHLDTVARSLAFEFLELQVSDDVVETVYEILKQNKPGAIDPADCYRDAIDHALTIPATEPHDDATDFQFGCNAAF